MCIIKPALYCLILVLTTGCMGSDRTPQMKKPTSSKATGVVPETSMARIDIPAREHGYSQLQNPDDVYEDGKHRLITSEAELETLLSEVEDKQYWNGNSKQLFSRALEAVNVNFDQDNILIYFHNESSGSNRVSVSDPVWTNKNVLCEIISKKPGEGMMGTADMAYYAYAWTVSKDIPAVTFEVRGKRVELPNQ